MRFHCLLLVLSWVPVTLAGQTADVSLAPDIVTVVTAGRWNQGSDTNGYYRATIRSAGFEHIVSSLTIDWVAESSEADTAHVVATRLVSEVSAGGASLGTPNFYRYNGGWWLQVRSINSHCTPALEEMWLVSLGKPGQITVRPPSVLVPGCT